MEDITVLKVEVKHSQQYGDKKVLQLADNTKWNVSEKKPFYNEISGPGIYSADFKEYQGKPYISFMRFKSAIDGQNKPVGPFLKAPSTFGAGGSSEANIKAKLEADKKRQDDIRLEFYCGIAKDILIANKREGVDIKHNDVLAMGLDMYKKHIDFIELMQVQPANKTYTANNKYEEAKAAQEADNEVDPPF